MKKLIAILMAIGFMAAATAPIAAADGRGHYRSHGPGFRYHGHYRHYPSSGDHFWIGLGVGALTGALITSFYYAPPPPPPRVVYYEPSTVIVHTQRIETPSVFDYSQIAVTAAKLNMRSQPGLDSEVIGQVDKGDVLDVIESIPDWFYVRAPDGRYGWVMDRYTRPAPPMG